MAPGMFADTAEIGISVIELTLFDVSLDNIHQIIEERPRAVKLTVLIFTMVIYRTTSSIDVNVTSVRTLGRKRCKE